MGYRLILTAVKSYKFSYLCIFSHIFAFKSGKKSGKTVVRTTTYLRGSDGIIAAFEPFYFLAGIIKIYMGVRI